MYNCFEPLSHSRGGGEESPAALLGNIHYLSMKKCHWSKKYLIIHNATPKSHVAKFCAGEWSNISEHLTLEDF
jgi:hypothetical protein